MVSISVRQVSDLSESIVDEDVRSEEDIKNT